MRASVSPAPDSLRIEWEKSPRVSDTSCGICSFRTCRKVPIVDYRTPKAGDPGVAIAAIELSRSENGKPVAKTTTGWKPLLTANSRVARYWHRAWQPITQIRNVIWIRFQEKEKFADELGCGMDHVTPVWSTTFKACFSAECCRTSSSVCRRS